MGTETIMEIVQRVIGDKMQFIDKLKVSEQIQKEVFRFYNLEEKR